MTQARCKTCDHWQGDRESQLIDERGQCRRYPPEAGGAIPMIRNQISRQPEPCIIWGSPETPASYSCGEWKIAAKLAQ